MLARIMLFAFMFFCAQAQAQSSDQFNMYRWNRTNALMGNGIINHSPWFEWWYYKVVLPDTGESFFVVYGVVNPWDLETTLQASRSYVSLGDFTERIIAEQNFAVSDFGASYREVHVQIGENNTATDKRALGQVKAADGTEASWDFSIARRWAFNPVSWMMGRGITNIEWYPAQADARCSGHFISKGIRKDFLDAPCYQDRNWGKSFPTWWTWIVSNHFAENSESALAIGGGKPKVLDTNSPIESVAIGLKHKGIEHSWRINDLNLVTTNVSFGTWEVTGENLTHRIEVSAKAPLETFLDLQFTTPLGEIFHDYETLTGKMTVKLFERKTPFLSAWHLIDTLTTNSAGIEYGSADKQEFFDLFSSQRMLYSSKKPTEE